MWYKVAHQTTLLDAAALRQAEAPAGPIVGEEWIDTDEAQYTVRYWTGWEWVRWALYATTDSTTTMYVVDNGVEIPVQHLYTDTDQHPYYGTGVDGPYSVLFDTDNAAYIGS